jgi:hypothetical protein
VRCGQGNRSTIEHLIDQQVHQGTRPFCRYACGRAYEQAGFVSREPVGTTFFGDPSDVRETVERIIQSLGS